MTGTATPTVTFTHTYRECADESYGAVTYAYTEQVLQLGSKAYSQVDTYTLATDPEEVSTYQADLIQLAAGNWIMSTEFKEFSGVISGETVPVEEDVAQAWISARRADHARNA